MSKVALYMALAKGIWSFHAPTANELIPLADRVLAGESLDLFAEHGTVKKTAIDADVANQINVATASAGPAAGSTAQVFRMGWYTDLNDVAPGSIAIVSVQGVILKSSYCGMGSMDRADRIMRAGQHKNVAAVLLDIDTPGGQVAGLSTVYDAILAVRAMGKPVLGFINDGDCYSAGYNTASACTEIWASHATCGVGSIGTVCQFTDSSEADRKEGRKRVAVYATDSTEKNQTFIKALAGDYGPLTAELDVLNKDFQLKIQKQRAAKIQDTSKVFKGQTYHATEGVKMGLIDKIGNMQAALNRCAELAKLGDATPAPTNDELILDDDEEDFDATTTPNSTTSMKQFPFMAALFGIAAKDFQNNAEGAHLNAAHLDLVEAQLQAAAGHQAAVTAANQARDTAQAALTTAQGELTTAQASVTAKEGELVKLRTQLANVPAGTEAPKPGQELAPTGTDKNQAANEWDAMDAEALADLAKHKAQYGL